MIMDVCMYVSSSDGIIKLSISSSMYVAIYSCIYLSICNLEHLLICLFVHLLGSQGLEFGTQENSRNIGKQKQSYL